MEKVYQLGWIFVNIVPVCYKPLCAGPDHTEDAEEGRGRGRGQEEEQEEEETPAQELQPQRGSGPGEMASQVISYTNPSDKNDFFNRPFRRVYDCLG